MTSAEFRSFVIDKQCNIFQAIKHKQKMIHAIQRQEGNFPCYATKIAGSCQQSGCCWRAGCVQDFVISEGFPRDGGQAEDVLSVIPEFSLSATV
ncbi:MAG: hypothetical protein HQM11_16545 [SAR324 cluster bacterium]|nr:hypothetical protein [SAR324 cluster bacterium]